MEKAAGGERQTCRKMLPPNLSSTTTAAVFPSSIVIVVFIFFSLFPAEAEPRLSADFWDELIESGNLPAYVSQEELRALQEAGLREQEDEEEEERVDLPPFPVLDQKQRRFAVNPGFKSYYDSSFKQEEGVLPDETGE